MDGRSDGRTVGRSDGRTVGRSDGRTVGRSDGRTVGRLDGRIPRNPRILCKIYLHSMHHVGEIHRVNS